MKLMRALRPAQRILSTAVVAAVATTCLISTGSASEAGAGSRTTDHAQVSDRTLATKEWRSSPLQKVAQGASPAMSTSSYEAATRRAVNRVRRAHGLRALRPAACAERAAGKWSAHLASTTSFYHRSMPALLKRCHARYAGETLGMGSITPKALVKMWMSSPPHRHILMSRQPRRIGIGATPDARGQWVVAANFLRL